MAYAIRGPIAGRTSLILTDEEREKLSYLLDAVVCQSYDRPGMLSEYEARLADEIIATLKKLDERS